MAAVEREMPAWQWTSRWPASRAAGRVPAEIFAEGENRLHVPLFRVHEPGERFDDVVKA